MKKIIYSLLAASVLMGATACNEDKFLEEKPLDFMSGNNSYRTEKDMDMAVTEFYYLVRGQFYTNYDHCADFVSLSDLVINCSDGNNAGSNLSASLNPTSGMASFHWTRLYKLIGQCNVLVSRVGTSEVPDEKKVEYEAKARFFRAFAYRTLAYLYGGVPITIEEVTTPRTDYTRASKEEVLAQAVEDARFAAGHLPAIDAVKDGEISAPAAKFLLGELLIATGANTEAITVLTQVIDDPNLSLMKSRFGSRASEDGDVYWDLFRRNNQNRNQGGNHEAIWVIQLKEDMQGGGSKTGSYFWDADGGYWGERYYAPQTGNFSITYNGATYKPYKWPVGDYTGGRGIGTLIATEYFNYIWGAKGSSDFKNDIRNSEYNFPRRFKYNNASVFGDKADLFGEYFDIENPQLPEGATIEACLPNGLRPTSQVPNRYMCGYQTKCTTPYNYPAAAYGNRETHQLTGTAGKTYTDQYMMRLAEAYLLRAEAYLNTGDKGAAAKDINEVRGRANASAATASQIDINYILDERMRELGIEEKRYITLARLGLVYDRISRLNPYYSKENSVDGIGIQPCHNLFPIPQSVKEANKDADLGQNDGYGTK